MDRMTRQIPNIPTQEKIALRINETVAVSGLSRSTIYELLKAGKLRAVKIGGRPADIARRPSGALAQRNPMIPWRSPSLGNRNGQSNQIRGQTARAHLPKLARPAGVASHANRSTIVARQHARRISSGK